MRFGYLQCFVCCSDLGACFGAFCCGCRVYRGSSGVESFVHNLEVEASGKRLLERPRKNILSQDNFTETGLCPVVVFNTGAVQLSVA